MQVDNKKTKLDSRLISILLALFMLFSVSIEGIAGNGDGTGGGGGGAGGQSNMAGSTGFQIRLSDPDTTMDNSGGTYILPNEYDATEEIVFGFHLNPNGGQRGFGIKDFSGVKIYLKSDPEKKAIVSLGQNTNADNINPVFYFEQAPPTDAEYNDHYAFSPYSGPGAFQNEKVTALHIAANVLQSGKTYCLLIPSNATTYNKDSTKTLGVDVIIEFTTEGEEAPLSLTSSLGDSLTSTDRTTLTVENGKQGYTYRFVIKNNDTGNTWSPWEGYKESNSFVWSAGPAGAKNGKTVYAYVKDANGNDVTSLELPVSVSDNKALTIDAITSSKGTSLSSMTTTALSATVSGGKAPYEYQFRVKNNDTGNWYTIQEFTKDKNSCEWWAGPKGAAKGKTVYVDVRDSNGDTVTSTLDVAVTSSNLTITSISSSKGTSLNYVMRTTLGAEVSGGKAPYEYRFRVKNNDTGNWYTIQEYTKNKNSCEWYAGPKGAAKGKTIYVDVKDANGDAVTSTLDVAVSNSDLDIVSVTSSIKNLTASSNTTLTATVKGGKAPYTYTFRVRNNDTGKWWTIQENKTNNSCKWLAGPAGGSKTIYVDVKDADGNTASDTLTVNVTDA